MRFSRSSALEFWTATWYMRLLLAIVIFVAPGCFMNNQNSVMRPESSPPTSEYTHFRSVTIEQHDLVQRVDANECIDMISEVMLVGGRRLQLSPRASAFCRMEGPIGALRGVTTDSRPIVIRGDSIAFVTRLENLDLIAGTIIDTIQWISVIVGVASLVLIIVWLSGGLT